MYQGSLGTVSNREDWIQAIDVVDDNGDDVTITGATITIAVRAKGSSSPELEASTDDGDVVIATPRFTFTFGVDDMRNLCAGQYDVGCTIEISGVTTQLIVGTVIVVDGVVS